MSILAGGCRYIPPSAKEKVFLASTMTINFH